VGARTLPDSLTPPPPCPTPFQYKREPLTQDEANRLANACETHAERLTVWTLPSLIPSNRQTAEFFTANIRNLNTRRAYGCARE
jgi:hypothetical protein